MMTSCRRSAGGARAVSALVPGGACSNSRVLAIAVLPSPTTGVRPTAHGRGPVCMRMCENENDTATAPSTVGGAAYVRRGGREVRGRDGSGASLCAHSALQGTQAAARAIHIVAAAVLSCGRATPVRTQARRRDATRGTGNRSQLQGRRGVRDDRRNRCAALHHRYRYRRMQVGAMHMPFPRT